MARSLLCGLVAATVAVACSSPPSASDAAATRGSAALLKSKPDADGTELLRAFWDDADDGKCDNFERLAAERARRPLATSQQTDGTDANIYRWLCWRRLGNHAQELEALKRLFYLDKSPRPNGRVWFANSCEQFDVVRSQAIVFARASSSKYRLNNSEDIEIQALKELSAYAQDVGDQLVASQAQRYLTEIVIPRNQRLKALCVEYKSTAAPVAKMAEQYFLLRRQIVELMTFAREATTDRSITAFKLDCDAALAWASNTDKDGFWQENFAPTSK